MIAVFEAWITKDCSVIVWREMALLKVGTTEGRFRMVMPDLMAAFESGYQVVNEKDTDCWNNTHIQGFMGDAVELRKMLSSGDLDLAFSGLIPQMPADIESRMILDEQLFFVISDHMLKKYRPEYISDGRSAGNTADLRDFAEVPVCRSLAHLHCMKILDAVLNKEKLSLNCVHVSAHYDLHQELAVRDYAACFCLGMYLPYLKKMNKNTENRLQVFRIKGLTDTNPVFLLQKKKYSADPTRDLFIKLLEVKCREIGRLQAEI